MWVRACSILVLLQAVAGQNDCDKLSSVVDKADSSQRVTPDYVSGPWFLMPEDFPFESWTKRPRMLEVMKLLGSVAQTVDEIENVVHKTRTEESQRNQNTMSEGARLLDDLASEIAAIDSQQKAKESFDPTQTRITDIVAQILTPKLAHLSDLYATSAEIRYPFAERLAEYTSDLLMLLRSKAEAKASMSGVVLPAELAANMAEFDSMAAGMKAKIDAEIAAATMLLNSNTRAIEDTSKYLHSVEAQITDLRSSLVELLRLGGQYSPHRKAVTTVSQLNQQALVHGTATAMAAQDGMLDALEGMKPGVVASLHHIASLMMGLVSQNTAEVSTALQPPLAMQSVTGDCAE